VRTGIVVDLTASVLRRQTTTPLGLATPALSERRPHRTTNATTRSFQMFATLLTLIQNVKNDRRGVTAMEYGLIASLIAVVIITGLTALGTKLSTLFTNISTQL
jgi:pilus assembly protein Flp/PilA